MNDDMWLLLGFLINIITVFLLFAQTRNKLEHRLTTCENYLKIILRHLNIEHRKID